jgi:hypothetical protein
LLPARQASAETLLVLLTSAVGKEAALPAARMLVSYVHGFLSMELAKAFRFGGSVPEAFQYGLTKVLDSLLLSKQQGWLGIRINGREFFGSRKTSTMTQFETLLEAPASESTVREKKSR